jgi:hypothetical protein
MRTVRFALILSLLALLVVSGCDSRPKRVAVSGKVLIDGEPLTYGTVIFLPKNGRQSIGPLDETGSFTLACYDAKDGALIGTHEVEVLAGQAMGSNATKWYAPKKYADRKTSGLTQEVNASMDPVVINLTWKGSPPEKAYIERGETDPGEDAMGKVRKKK